MNDRPEYRYNSAMAVIHRQYRNPHNLLSLYGGQVRQMVPLKAENARAFRKLFNILIKCQTIEVDSHYNLLETTEIICMVLLKLTLHLQDRWNHNPLQLQKISSKGPQVIDLTNFFEDKMTLVNDPLYSRGAVGQYVIRAPRCNEKRERKRFTTMETVTDNSCNISYDTSNKVASKVEMYPMCNKNHDIENCTYYLPQTMEETSKFLFKNKLCYGCLKTVTKEHNAKTCLSRRSCKVCNGKNETTLDGYLKKKIAITNDKRLIHDEKNQGGVKCASVNTSTDYVYVYFQ